MRGPLNCCLCAQIGGLKELDKISELMADEVYTRRIPIESDHFAVIPSLGSLAPGHCLLSPKDHIRSVAGIIKENAPEYLLLKHRLVRVLEELYRVPVHTFEHGSASAGNRVLCSVDHAHLHLIPAKASVWDYLRSKYEWSAIGESPEELRNRVGEKEYLFYESPDNVCRVAIAPNDGIESQYLRKVFATALGNRDEWNWRECPNASMADETYRILKSYPVELLALA